MITTIVEFELARPLSREQAKEIFLSTAPKYRGMPGLIRKYYFVNQEGTRSGGVYLWQSRQDADRLYNDDWKSFVRGKYGVEPRVIYLETPVVVDNVINQVIADD